MKKIFIILFLLFVSLFTFGVSPVYAQQPTLEWSQIYYGPDTSGKAEFILLDKSGNVYVGGTTHSNIEGDNIVLIKYSNSGVQQWIAMYNGTANGQDVATGMVIDDSANIYLTGFSAEVGTGQDFVTLKYNRDGLQQWVVRYNDVNNLADGANSLFWDINGYIYVTGAIVILPNGRDVITIKYRATTGDSVWVRRFHEAGTHGNFYDYGLGIANDNQGNVFVTGSSDANFGPPYADFLTIKYDSAGTFKWSQKYDGPTHYNDLAHYIGVDTSGNIFVSGTSYNNTGNEDFATIKYDNNGTQQWVQRYSNNGTGGGDPTGLSIDKTGNIIVTGYSGGVNSEFVTVKYNNIGSQLWVQRYSGLGYGVILDDLNNIYVTGNGPVTGSTNCVTIKYNTNGIQQWTANYNGPANLDDWGNAVALDTLGNVYVTGWTEFFENNEFKIAFLTLKYSQPNGIIQISSETPAVYKLEQNYPNPFNPTTNIKYQIKSNINVNLKIYNMLGMEVETLINQNQKPGTFEINWNGSDFSSGVYFYTLIAGNYKETKKLILLK